MFIVGRYNFNSFLEGEDHLRPSTKDSKRKLTTKFSAIHQRENQYLSYKFDVTIIAQSAHIPK
mgnify:FL=1